MKAVGNLAGREENTQWFFYRLSHSSLDQVKITSHSGIEALAFRF